MKNNLILKIGISDLSLDHLHAIASGKGVVAKRDSYLEWITPLLTGNESCSIVVRQSTSPMQEDTDAIYVRCIEDLRHFGAIPETGGIQRLLATTDPNEFINALKDRLSVLHDRLTNEHGAYLFGAYRNGLKCISYCQSLGITVLGFIDNDLHKQGKEYYGYRVFPLDAVAKDALIVNTSGRYCADINKQLSESGYHSSIDMMEFLFAFDLPFQAESNFRNYAITMHQSRFRIATLYLMLDDKMSRSVLDGLIDFRMTLDSTILSRITSPYREEFFAPDILQFSSEEVFVDGGAFDGDSFLRFLAMAPQFGRAYLFEPDEAICRRAIDSFGSDHRLAIHNAGLSSHSGEVRFSTTSGMDGAISEHGNTIIKVVSIDECVKEKVTHIKLDVEGSEEAALLGARNQIGKFRPKMAIALYHRAMDLWQLPKLIESFGGGYKYSIRHYSQTVDDSVIYALPLRPSP